MPAKILVVEDEEPISQLLAYNLQKEGFSVTVAGDGDEALLAVDEERPDLVLLDWMLPNVSGIELCRQIRTRNSTREIPVIMLTARGEEEDRVRGLDVGADDYVTKPFSMSELVARMRAVLRRTAPALAGRRGDLCRPGARPAALPGATGAAGHPPRTDGVPAARRADPAAGAGLFPRAASGPGLGAGRLRGDPDGGRAYRSAPEGAEPARRPGSDPDGAVLGVCAGRDLCGMTGCEQRGCSRVNALKTKAFIFNKIR